MKKKKEVKKPMVVYKDRMSKKEFFRHMKDPVVLVVGTPHFECTKNV